MRCGLNDMHKAFLYRKYALDSNLRPITEFALAFPEALSQLANA